jgi:hypothetical protein
VTSTRRLTGRIQVPLPPEEAFRLFTPRGEQDWVHGWRPHFPAPASVTCSRVALAAVIAGHPGVRPWRPAGSPVVPRFAGAADRLFP